MSYYAEAIAGELTVAYGLGVPTNERPHPAIPISQFRPVFDSSIQFASDAVRDHLWERFTEHAETEDRLGGQFREFFNTLVRTLAGDNGARYLIHVDWKAWDEVTWQAQAIADAIGLADHFEWHGQAETDPALRSLEISSPLIAFDWWLSSRGYRYVSFECDWDARLGVVCPSGQLATLRQNALSVNVRTMLRQ